MDPADPAALHPDEQLVLRKLVQSFRQSEKLQQHVEFLYAKGSVYHIENGNLLYHGAVPMTSRGTFAMERFEGHRYSGRALMDYCDERARRGYFAPEGSAARQSGQDFLWYLWCGKLSPLYGRSAMTTFERLYVEDTSTHTEVKDPYYTWYNDEAVCRRILAEFGLPGASHIVNGHVPVREKRTAKAPSRAADGSSLLTAASAVPTTKRPVLRATRWCIPAAPCRCAPISPLRVPKRR